MIPGGPRNQQLSDDPRREAPTSWLTLIRRRELANSLRQAQGPVTGELGLVGFWPTWRAGEPAMEEFGCTLVGARAFHKRCREPAHGFGRRGD
jgi:hypothetical protein